MSEPRLHHEFVTAPEKSQAEVQAWLLILHGAFGSGRNWAGVARQLVQQRPEWGVLLADLRQHGRSTGLPGPHTLRAAARDLHVLAQSSGLPIHAVLGHSFGGKVALQWAAMGAAGAGMRQVWIADSTPEQLLRDGQPQGDAWEMLQRLKRLPASFSSRAAAIADLQAEGVSEPVAAWMAINLEREAGRVRWRIDLQALESLLGDFYATELWEVVEHPPADLQLHLIKAGASDLIRPAALQRIEAAVADSGRVYLHHVQGGHWLNLDNPDALVRLLAEYLF